MIQVTEEQRGEIEALLRQRDLPPRQRERLEMVKARGSGQEVGMIARWSGRTVRTVRRWLARFAGGGPPARRDAPRPGRPVEADAPYRHALDAAVAVVPSALGLPYDVRTAARWSACLAQETGVLLTPGWRRTVLQRQGDVYGRPRHTLPHRQDAAATAACAAPLTAVEQQVAAAPERYEVHYQDETPVETCARCGIGAVYSRPSPLGGAIAASPCSGASRDSARPRTPPASACIWPRSTHATVHQEVYLVLDNGPCPTGKQTTIALAERHAWLHVLWLAPYSPQLDPTERAWKRLKRDARSHVAPTLRACLDEIVIGLRQLGGERLDIVDHVPDWFIAGQRKEPTGRPAGRPKGAKDAYKRAPYRKMSTTLPAAA